jgi:hypothetical protein
MLSFLFKTILGASLCVVVLSTTASSVSAGGGTYELINFDDKGTYPGLSKEFVLRVHDANAVSDPYLSVKDYPVVANEEFRFVAHSSIEGAFCNPSQVKSDSQGYIRATCGAKVNGRFVFHVESASRSDIPSLGEIEVMFQGSVPSPLPVVQSPKPVISPKPKVTPSPKVTTSPKPSLSPSPTAEPEISPEPSPSPEPVEEAPKPFWKRWTEKISKWLFFWKKE